MKVKFVPTKDHKFVEIFVDGAHLMTRDVSTDNDGHEFIYVPNLLRKGISLRNIPSCIALETW